MKLLVQGDDYGFTKGVTYGIIEAIDNGILTCTGMFTNMEIAPWAAQFIKERPDFCFGIDFNLVAGPVSYTHLDGQLYQGRFHSGNYDGRRDDGTDGVCSVESDPAYRSGNAGSCAGA